ncbi:MAG: MFS transporter, partial [Bacteroidetes bacterium]|nr:MFS transporter [Bacteroidota bacterium]
MQSRLAFGGRVYYGWLVVAVTFLTLVVSAGVRSAPGVLIVPLEVQFGWSRAAISFAVSIGLLLYGLCGPFAGRLMDRSGPRRLMLFGLLLAGSSTAASAAISELWQLDLLWGLVSGIGTGVTASVLGVAVATRWFVARRGLVMGLFGAASSAGQLVFLPFLMWLVVSVGWRGAVTALAAAVLLALLPALLLMRNDPSELGLRPYGALASPSASLQDPARLIDVTMQALRVPEFWLLAGTFFVCGFTAAGLIGTHLIAHSIDHGVPEIMAAEVVALMGTMNFVGTLASGWLTDRFDPRKLLACYYSFRGLALLLLPFV